MTTQAEAPGSVPPEEIVRQWWAGLSPGDRAELRRARSITQVMMTRPANQLRYALRDTQWRDISGIALNAGVQAHVRKDDQSCPLGERLAGQMKDSRFRRLLRIDNHDELLRPAIRSIGLLGQTVNVGELAAALYWWNDWTKRDLAYTYYTHHKET